MWDLKNRKGNTDYLDFLVCFWAWSQMETSHFWRHFGTIRMYFLLPLIGMYFQLKLFWDLILFENLHEAREKRGRGKAVDVCIWRRNNMTSSFCSKFLLKIRLPDSVSLETLPPPCLMEGKFSNYKGDFRSEKMTMWQMDNPHWWAMSQTFFLSLHFLHRPKAFFFPQSNPSPEEKNM